MREPFIFAALDSWKGIFNRSVEQQMALVRSADFRAAFRNEIKDGGGSAIFRGRWDRVHVTRVENEHNRRWLNLSIAELAATTGKDAVDALLDLALDERMELGVTLSVINVNPDVVSRILKLPSTLIGLSDAGAHVAQHCDAGLTSYLLHEWVHRRGVLTLEEAVRRLTSELADFLELRTKGRLAPGMDADLVIFDPATIKPLKPEWVNDLPGGEPRLIERSEGIEYTIVGGEVLFAHDEYQGGLPGKVMRTVSQAG
jgi:N-acyl-D-aspartate/D-glutamate deacylase